MDEWEKPGEWAVATVRTLVTLILEAVPASRFRESYVEGVLSPHSTQYDDRAWWVTQGCGQSVAYDYNAFGEELGEQWGVVIGRTDLAGAGQLAFYGRSVEQRKT